MRYEDYKKRGHLYADYVQLSQFQRLRGIIMCWRGSPVPLSKRISFCAMWDGDDLDNDYIRPADWWHPRYWKFGIDICQNFERISFGPVTMLLAL